VRVITSSQIAPALSIEVCSPFWNSSMMLRHSCAISDEGTDADEDATVPEIGVCSKGVSGFASVMYPMGGTTRLI
jgi:hypothetical protein